MYPGVFLVGRRGTCFSRICPRGNKVIEKRAPCDVSVRHKRAIKKMEELGSELASSYADCFGASIS